MDTPQAPRPERQEFYDRLDRRSLAPLWERLRFLVTREPRSPALPTHWRYEDVRPYVMESGGIIAAKEAERRVIILENPGLKGKSQITNSLYAGLQLILPGEVAPAHRHVASALRFVVEGTGAYTAVDGEKTIMRPGDFVITPSWTWHDHGNESREPMVWMDGLDIPIVTLFDTSFAEPHNSDSQQLSRPTGDALARYGSGLMPIGTKRTSRTSPIFNYPYMRTREALEQMKRAEEWDPAQGLRLGYVNPTDGGWAMPTIATFMQLLPRNFRGTRIRSTDGVIYAPVEGRGRTTVTDYDGKSHAFAWGPRDVFVVPSWMWHRHEASEDSTLFSFSDRAAQEKLGLFREERAAA
jgi:gentisate 1,2-dioxygenase